MDEANHCTTVMKCNLCGEIPRNAPLYHCPLDHQYCTDCYEDLKHSYRGYVKNGATCVICKMSGVFTQSNIYRHFFNNNKAKPGIGRPSRHNTNTIASGRGGNNCRRRETKEQDRKNVTVESLFQLSSEELKLLLGRKNHCNAPFTTKESQRLEDTKQVNSKKNSNDLPSHQSKIPIKCPHKSCKKVVALSTFITHFKHEHSNIPKYSVARGKELCLPCDVSIIEHYSNFCLAMITVYEFNRIDVRNSQSSQSVIRTCEKFNRQVPIDSFWLMVTGSPEREPNISSAIYWIFCPSEEYYQSTIELCSKCDSMSVSTFCEVYNSCHKLKFNDIASCLRCLLVNHNSFGALLQEGPELKLRITIH